MTLLQQVDAQISRFHKAMGEATGFFPVGVRGDSDTVTYVYNDMVEIEFRWMDSPELATGIFESDHCNGEVLNWKPMRSKGSAHYGAQSARIAQTLRVVEITLANLGFYRFRSDQHDYSEAVGFIHCLLMVKWKPLSRFFMGNRENLQGTEI